MYKAIKIVCTFLFLTISCVGDIDSYKNIPEGVDITEDIVNEYMMEGWLVETKSENFSCFILNNHINIAIKPDGNFLKRNDLSCEFDRDLNDFNLYCEAYFCFNIHGLCINGFESFDIHAYRKSITNNYIGNLIWTFDISLPDDHELGPYPIWCKHYLDIEIDVL